MRVARIHPERNQRPMIVTPDTVNRHLVADHD
jgi:hypothetical protein